MKNLTSLYIDNDESVKVSEDDIREARRLEEDPKTILALIDLIFLCEDNSQSRYLS